MACLVAEVMQMIAAWKEVVHGIGWWACGVRVQLVHIGIAGKYWGAGELLSIILFIIMTNYNSMFPQESYLEHRLTKGSSTSYHARSDIPTNHHPSSGLVFHVQCDHLEPSLLPSYAEH